MKKKAIKKAVLKFPYESTSRIKYLDSIRINMERVYSDLIKPCSFFGKRFEISDILIVSKEKAQASFELWEEVYREYPELKDAGGLFTDGKKIYKL